MKPEKLTIEAFGPFTNKTVIDFSVFGNEGLYLISGPTGSGKTTLFDALSYALYGVTTADENRDAEMMRSQYAREDVYTYAELIFSEKGKTYKIKRSPAQFRPRRRGTGLVTEPASAGLLLPDGNTLTKKDQIDNKVEEIVGMTANQFAQIVMLAQGKFSRFLVSKTDEKRMLFKKLFDTENYGKLQQLLFDKAKAAREAFDDIRRKQRAVIESVEAAEDSKWHDRLEEARKSEYPPSDFLDVLKGLHIEAKDQYDEVSLALDSCLKSKNEAEYEISRFNDKQRMLADLSHKEQELELASAYLDETKREYDQNSERQQKKDHNRIEIANLEKVLPKYEERDNLEKELSLKNKMLAEKNGFLLDCASKLADRNSCLESLRAEQNGLKNVQEELDKFKDTRFKTQNRLVQLEAIIEKIRTLEETAKQLDDTRLRYKVIDDNAKHIAVQKNELEEEKTRIETKLATLKDAELVSQAVKSYSGTVKSIKENLDSLESKHSEIKKLNERLSELALVFARRKKEHADMISSYYLAGAASLASRLEKNKPCPVCGSLHHPSPAVFNGEVYSKDDLLKAETEEKKAQDDVREAERLLNQAEAFISATEENIHKLKKDLPEELQGKEISVMENEISAWKKQADENLLTKENLESDLKTLASELNELNENIVSLKEEQSVVMTSEKLQLASCENLRNQIKEKADKDGVELSAIFSIYDSIKEEKEIIDSHIASLEKDKKRLTEIAGIIEALTKEIEALNKAKNGAESDIRVLDIEIKAIQKKITEIGKDFLFDSRKEVEDRIKSLSNENSALDEQIKAVINAFNTANERKSSLIGNVEELKKSISMIPDYDIEELKSRSSELDVQRLRLDDERTYHNTRLVNINKAIDLYGENEAKGAESMRKYAMLQELSDVANGTMSGENKLSIETYVQTRYLDRILVRANRKLLSMSDGQYEMERSGMARNKAQKMGLDINVMDHFTGKQRPASTLSGGETFKASLALALGLSEEIQADAGAVKIETMFVDEGFGTLDAESLGTAINVLSSLASDGRLVGVISHVQELKDRIDKQIVVEKDKNQGSKVMIKC